MLSETELLCFFVDFPFCHRVCLCSINTQEHTAIPERSQVLQEESLLLLFAGAGGRRGANSSLQLYQHPPVSPRAVHVILLSGTSSKGAGRRG